MDEANVSEIEYLSTSEEISEEDNEDYNIDETDDEENNDNYNENEDEDEDIDDMMQVDIEEGLSKEIIDRAPNRSVQVRSIKLPELRGSGQVKQKIRPDLNFHLT